MAQVLMTEETKENMFELDKVSIPLVLPILTKQGKIALNHNVDVTISPKGFICNACKTPKKNTKTVKYTIYEKGTLLNYCKGCAKKVLKEQGNVPSALFNLTLQKVETLTRFNRKCVVAVLTEHLNIWHLSTPLIQLSSILNNSVKEDLWAVPEAEKELIMYTLLNKFMILISLRSYAYNHILSGATIRNLDIPCPITLDKMEVVSFVKTRDSYDITYTSPKMFSSRFTLSSFTSLSN